MKRAKDGASEFLQDLSELDNIATHLRATTRQIQAFAYVLSSYDMEEGMAELPEELFIGLGEILSNLGRKVESSVFAIEEIHRIYRHHQN